MNVFFSPVSLLKHIFNTKELNYKQFETTNTKIRFIYQQFPFLYQKSPFLFNFIDSLFFSDEGIDYGVFLNNIQKPYYIIENKCINEQISAIYSSKTGFNIIEKPENTIFEKINNEKKELFKKSNSLFVLMQIKHLLFLRDKSNDIFSLGYSFRIEEEKRVKKSVKKMEFKEIQNFLLIAVSLIFYDFQNFFITEEDLDEFLFPFCEIEHKKEPSEQKIFLKEHIMKLDKIIEKNKQIIKNYEEYKNQSLWFHISSLEMIVKKKCVYEKDYRKYNKEKHPMFIKYPYITLGGGFRNIDQYFNEKIKDYYTQYVASIEKDNLCLEGLKQEIENLIEK